MYILEKEVYKVEINQKNNDMTEDPNSMKKTSKKEILTLSKNNINVFTTSNSNNISSSPKKGKGINSKLLTKRNSAMNVKLKGELSDIEKISVKKILSEHFLFKDKNTETINQILEKIEIKKYPINSEIESIDSFYIIKEGKVELSNNLGIKNNYIQDETFGEIALIEKKKNNIKVKILKDSIFYVLKGEIFRELVQKINDSELKERLLFISYVPIFRTLNAIELNNISSFMYKCEFNINQRIITEGDYAESLFIIKEGSVACSKEEIIIRHLKEKDYFGENALLFNEKRSLSVFATSKTSCYQISQGMLIQSLGENYRNIILKGIVKAALKNSKYLKLFQNEYFFNKFFINHQIQICENNEILVKSGENNRNLYILIQGDLRIEDEGKNEIIITKRGELFGDINLKENKRFKHNIFTKGNCKLLVFNWDSIIQDNFNYKIEKKKLLDFFNQLYHLKQIQIFKDTSELRLIDVCKMMKKEKFNQDEIIFNEGENGDKLYLIKKGKVDVYKNNKFIRELCEGNCFGEMSLLINEKRTATVKAKSKVSLYSLTRNNFNSCIDKNMLNYLSKKISLQDSFNNKLEDFYFCKSLGRGKFGTVSLIHNNKNFYAMKAVRRKDAEKQKILIKYFITERTNLLKLDHPFIMKLVRTYKNEENIFYMTEYINGRVLSKYLENREQKDIKNIYLTQFYLSFILICVNYLNGKNICHRDLKPDNIMIDEKGYIKLIDFGTSIEIKNYTSTITGTPHYIAPEVLIGKSYSFQCDYWSIGIIAHEIFYNFYPFGNKANDPVDVYREIIKKDLKLPKNGNNVFNDFVKGFLKKKVNERICSFEIIKRHEFYKDFNWDELIEFKLNPPYIPKNSSLKNFDEYNVRYIDFLENEKNNKKMKESIKEEKEDEKNKDKNKNKKFDPNWADIF